MEPMKNFLRALRQNGQSPWAEPYPVEPHILGEVKDSSLAKDPFGVPISVNVVATM
jgi:hypothetical protein